MGQEGEQFTRRELREPAGKKVRDELDLTVQDMLQVVDVALEAGWMRLEPVSGFGKRKREVLVATSEAGN
jgi:lysozyme family protein